MRIVHYHSGIRLEAGGTVRFVLDLCGALATAGHEVVLASTNLQDAPREWDGSPGKPRLAPLNPARAPFEMLSSAALDDAQTLIEDADAVHLHGAWATSNIQFAKLCRRAGVPYVATPHGMLDEWCVAHGAAKKRLFHALFGRRYWNHAAAAHCTAEFERQQSVRWFPSTRAVVIPPVLDLEPFKHPPGPEEARARFPPPLADAPTVLFLSRLHPKKRPASLIAAVAGLSRRRVACNLLIAGSGDPAYESSLRSLIGSEGIADRARLVGMVRGSAKISLYQLADLFVLPTSQENFGIVLAEALACGTPTITTKGVDIWPELETSGGAVILNDPTPENLADAIAGLLADPARRTQMSSSGRNWVMNELRPEKVVRQYSDLYSSLS